MKTIYVIPGLGADSSLFSAYSFPDFHLKVIEWIDPLADEALEDYAVRLSTVISEINPIIIGVSFGGMLAVEISRLRKDAMLIILSSATSYRQIPWLYRKIAASGIIHLSPACLLQRSGWAVNQFFGVRTNVGKALLSQILKNTSPRFTKWAVTAIGKWQGDYGDTKALRLHGRSDLILPAPKNKDYLLEGGHFVIFEKAAEINRLIIDWLDTRGL